MTITQLCEKVNVDCAKLNSIVTARRGIYFFILGVPNQQLFLLAQHKNLCYNKSYENETMDLNGGNHEKN